MKLCRDCVEQYGLGEAGRLKRPAPHPGPRCLTHHRKVVHARKARSHELTMKRKYSLEEGQYRELYQAQGGLCAICRRASGRSKRLSVDHDHACCPGKTSCGKCVRGLLCGVCNRVILGWYTPDMLLRAVAYLEAPPAQGLDASPG